MRSQYEADDIMQAQLVTPSAGGRGRGGARDAESEANLERVKVAGALNLATAALEEKRQAMDKSCQEVTDAARKIVGATLDAST